MHNIILIFYLILYNNLFFLIYFKYFQYHIPIQNYLINYYLYLIFLNIFSDFKTNLINFYIFYIIFKNIIIKLFYNI